MTSAKESQGMGARYDDAQLAEAGRKIFAGEADFIWAASTLETLPPMQGMEIAFAGRSNVGKSSLVNALTNRNAPAPRIRPDGHKN